MKFALFLPMYNVESTITRVVDSIPEQLFTQVSRIICIDNSSADKTLERLTARLEDHPHRNKFKILKNKKNYSLGGSTILAIREAKEMSCDYLINLHTDGQATGEDLVRLYDQCDLSQQNLVLGSRFVAGSQIHDYNLDRKIGNWFFIYLQQFLLRRNVKDLGALMALPLHRLDFDFDRIPSDMGYQPLLLIELIRRHRNILIHEVGISWGEVESSSVNPWAYGSRHLVRCLRYAMGRSFVSLPKSPDLISEPIGIFNQKIAR